MIAPRGTHALFKMIEIYSESATLTMHRRFHEIFACKFETVLTKRALCRNKNSPSELFEHNVRLRKN